MEILRFRIVVGTALKKLLAYANLVAPIYASWATDIEYYRLLLMEDRRCNE